MKKNALIIVLAALVVASGVLGLYLWRAHEDSSARVVLYEAPSSMETATSDDLALADELSRDFLLKLSSDTKLSVNGAACAVYETNVNLNHGGVTGNPAMSRTPVAYFDFDGSVELTVERGAAFESAVVRPLSAGITPKVDGNRVTFRISEPGAYTLEFDGAAERCLHIFANPIDDFDASQYKDGELIYIGPGEWDIDSIEVKSGQTLYVAGGAVVHGKIVAADAENVSIRGRGIIDGSCFRGDSERTVRVPVDILSCKNVSAEGLILLNPNGWSFEVYDSENVRASNIKIISNRPNGDGFTIQSCINCEFSDSFVRGWDDNLVVKCYKGSSANITFRNMQLWTDLAQSMEIGYETNKGEGEDVAIHDILFENITVLHAFHKPVMSIHNGDDAAVSDITYRNITVEDASMGNGDGAAEPYLMDFRVLENPVWSTTSERGTISRVNVENVNVLTQSRPSSSLIMGYDSEHTVEDIKISGLTICGKKITDLTSAAIGADPTNTKNVTIE